MSRKDVIMGRADVLLRFLQLTEKDCPEDLQAHLEGLDDDTEHRPLVDQIVDRIIAGDNTLYEKYAQARRDAGSKNPYFSQEDSRRSPNYEQALGFFVTRWTDLENRMRQAAMLKTDLADPMRHKYATGLWWKVGAVDLDPTLRREFDYLRRLRNEVVHGIEAPPPKRLMEAGRLVQEIAEQLPPDNPLP